MMKMLGFGDINSLEWWTIVLSGTAIALIVGWLLDLVVGRTGFGILGNALIAVLGSCVALVAYRNYIGEVGVGVLPMVMGAVTVSVVAHFFLLFYLRRVLKL
jgi:ABC-type branched-subunit amino acid transport system permease subunit